MQVQPPSTAAEQLTTNPLLILHRELKDKTLKKQSLESITTISLSLGRKKTREQLIPYLANMFVEEHTDIQKLILKALSELLHPIYIGKSQHTRVILEVIIDILCVYANREIRDEAYACLEKVFAVMDVRKAQNMLVQALVRLNEEEDTCIREVVLKMIPYVYAGADGQREQELLKIVHSYKAKQSDQKLLSQMLTDFIKVMPPAPEAEIREIISLLISTGDKTILSNLIEPVILLGRISGGDSTVQYLQTILQNPDSEVICTALKKYWELSEVFTEESLEPLREKIQQYDSQSQEIKNTILQLLDSLPLSQQQILKLGQPPSSLQLKTTLSQTLCRVNDIKALQKLFTSSDPNFQVKIFPKLPSISPSHIEIVERILSMKSWRQKLTVLQNIDARTAKGEDTGILLDKLGVLLGDRIACVRAAAADSIRNAMVKHSITIGNVWALVCKSCDSRNWFERQSLYRLVLDLIRQSPAHLQEREKLEQIWQKGQSETVENNRSILAQMNQILNHS